jgi:hypothetical protein
MDMKSSLARRVFNLVGLNLGDLELDGSGDAEF